MIPKVKAAGMRLVSAFPTISDLFATALPILFVVSIFSGCTNLMFRPDAILYNTPYEFGLDHEDIFFKTVEGLQLHGWFLLSKGDTKGTVYYLHGNGQNISAHIRSVHWLPEKGYHVFMLDYRGYGDSTGAPSVAGVLDDIQTGFDWLVQNPKVQKGPIFLLGQSLGASLGVYFVGTKPIAKKELAGVILDAPFSSLRKIAREKLDGFWLTWPFQYPISLLVSDNYNPENVIQNISPVPVLIMHSDEDMIIPSSHGTTLFELAREPKFFIQTKNRHIYTFKYKEYRQIVLEFMARFN